jgi:hypothetical protein
VRQRLIVFVKSMTKLIKIGQDETDTKYFAVKYDSGCLTALPWGEEEFDCLIFKNKDDDLMKLAIDELLSKHCDWIHTTGKDSEYWHDYIDRRSVELGRQGAVGNGNPMTAWHTEMSRPEDWENTLNFGHNEYFLIVLIGFTKITPILETLKRKLTEDLTRTSTPTGE